MLAPLAFLATLALAPQEAPAPQKHPLAVLYAGEPGSEREADWLAFLRRRFERVEATSPTELIASGAEGFDVVVADGTVSLVDDRLDMRGCTRSRFPEDWSRPTILVGSAGKAAERASRIGWL